MIAQEESNSKNARIKELEGAYAEIQNSVKASQEQHSSVMTQYKEREARNVEEYGLLKKQHEQMFTSLQDKNAKLREIELTLIKERASFEEKMNDTTDKMSKLQSIEADMKESLKQSLESSMRMVKIAFSTL